MWASKLYGHSQAKMGVKLYERRPQYIRQQPNFQLFKKTVKQYLITTCLYDLNYVT